MRFDLEADRLEVRHNGRSFHIGNVRKICDVGESPKQGDLTKIGKFGIGFKSVYAVTTRPEIHSGDEHFAIEKYIRPTAVLPAGLTAPWTTLFVLPLNKSGVSRAVARAEIGKRLLNLNSRTLLFLRHIRDVKWSSSDGTGGSYRRQEGPSGPARRISVVREAPLQKTLETWLIFESSVVSETTESGLRVEVAFALGRNQKTGKEEIDPLNDSKLSVFFPTEIPTHLGFLVQGPYRTTPARENVPHGDNWNRKLIPELCTRAV